VILAASKTLAAGGGTVVLIDPQRPVSAGYGRYDFGYGSAFTSRRASPGMAAS
jgi:hypothetical protein